MICKCMEIILRVITFTHKLNYTCIFEILPYSDNPYDQFYCGFFLRSAQSSLSIFLNNVNEAFPAILVLKKNGLKQIVNFLLPQLFFFKMSLKSNAYKVLIRAHQQHKPWLEVKLFSHKIPLLCNKWAESAGFNAFH